jgi:hypothetical protein
MSPGHVDAATSETTIVVDCGKRAGRAAQPSHLRRTDNMERRSGLEIVVAIGETLFGLVVFCALISIAHGLTLFGLAYGIFAALLCTLPVHQMYLDHERRWYLQLGPVVMCVLFGVVWLCYRLSIGGRLFFLDHSLVPGARWPL